MNAGSVGAVMAFANGLAVTIIALLSMYGTHPPAELAAGLTAVINGLALFVVHRFPPKQGGS